jgi:hypothetical protein
VTKVGDEILAGMKDALDYLRGDKSKGIEYTYPKGEAKIPELNSLDKD